MNREQLVKELFRPARQHFDRRKMCVDGWNEHWSTDLIDMKAYSRKNKGYTFILLVIDSLSKFVWCEPLKKKSGANVYDAFIKIFNRCKTLPRLIQSDLGREFYNAKVSNLFKMYNIKHYSTNSIIKASFAERAIRTIKRKIFMNFTLRDSFVYHDILQKIVNEYNNTVHSKTGVKPAAVNSEIAKKLLDTVYCESKVIMKKPKFSVGEYVRISKQKTFFEKGYTSGWRTEIFKVKKINHTQPITYIIEDLQNETIQGCFYELELAKTKFTTS